MGGNPIDMIIVSRPPFPGPTPSPYVQTVVLFELVVSAALLGRKNCEGGGQIIFKIFTTITYMAALLTIHDGTGRSLVRVIYL
jgi:hypothetical protein